MTDSEPCLRVTPPDFVPPPGDPPIDLEEKRPGADSPRAPTCASWIMGTSFAPSPMDNVTGWGKTPVRTRRTLGHVWEGWPGDNPKLGEGGREAVRP